MNTYHLFAIISALSCINNYVYCAGFRGVPKELDLDEASLRKLQQDFRELDGLLCERAISSDPETNMEFIEKLLAKPGPLNFVGVKIKHKLEDAERLFLSLKQLQDEKLCNRKGFKIISDNAKALQSAPFLRRMGEIFSYYAKQHHTICSRLYPNMVAKRLANMDQDQLKRLEFVVSKLMNRYPSSGTEEEGLFSLIKNNNVGPDMQRLEKLLVDLIKAMPADEEVQISKDLAPEERHRQIFKLTLRKYLIEPCEHYIGNLADDIFDPATALIHHHGPNILETQFYQSWARYKFCINAYNQILAD